ncbi:MAG: hypothetical protein GF417_08500 [Candidatus Latescibacteria bacterium]|nr:hypothetical protein [bacterium]MBD3424461.1 hypothetical protein [Candidatus Latescibacterota bacterium]
MQLSADNRVCLLVAALAAAILLSDCAIYPVGPGGGNSRSISGEVVDQEGRGVEGAGLLIDYLLEYHPGSRSGETSSLRKLFHRSVAGDTRIRIWVERYCTNEHIITLLDTVMNEGFFNINWNGLNSRGQKCRPGAYNAILYQKRSFEATIDTMTIFLKRGHYSGYQLSEIEVNGLTGTGGKFRLSQECLPFGYTAPWIAEGGDTLGTYTVSRYVDIWVIHDRYDNKRMDSIYVDRSGIRGIKIQLPRARTAPLR